MNEPDIVKPPEGPTQCVWDIETVSITEDHPELLPPGLSDLTPSAEQTEAEAARLLAMKKPNGDPKHAPLEFWTDKERTRLEGLKKNASLTADELEALVCEYRDKIESEPMVIGNAIMDWADGFESRQEQKRADFHGLSALFAPRARLAGFSLWTSLRPTEPICVVVESEAKEKEALQQLLALLNEHQFCIGYNIMNFDLIWLRQRCAIKKLQFPIEWFTKNWWFDSEKFIDLIDAWKCHGKPQSGEHAQRNRLDDVCRAMGFETKPADVRGWNDWPDDLKREYMLHDIRVTARIAKRLGIL